MNNYSDAIKQFKLAYIQFLIMNDFINAGISLNKIGEAYMLSQQFRPALNFLLKGFIHRKDHNDSEGLLESLNSLGEIYFYLGIYDKSMSYYEKCIYQSEKNNNDYILATALKNRGWLKYKSGKSIHSILKDLIKSKNIAEELNRKRLLLSCYDNLGDIYFIQNDFVQSLYYFNKLLSVCDGQEYTHMEIRALKNIGNTHRELGDLKTAESFLVRAMSLAKEKNILAMLRDCSLDKAHLYERKREFKIAYLHFKNYHNYAMKIEKEKRTEKMIEILKIDSSNNSNENLKLIRSINNSRKNEKFNNKLLVNYPELSPRQIEIAGLLRNGMTSKEISVLLNIEVDSINKQRARIRKAMNLSRNINLMSNLQKL
ncbi:MAG: LuxR family transcriptional regulator [Candidatus Marinimicrobia bacterium]|nr:LuxR family transcriptional regulator [Candidatus Neomarinimicrobiota bacterium]